MPLPKIEHPIYETKLPSTGETVKFRPLLVKEEKLLLTVKEGETPESELINVYEQILNNCILSDIDIQSLPLFDVQYLFIKIRAKSVDNIVNLKIKDEKDENHYEVEIDLDKIEVDKKKNPDPYIAVNDEIIVKMRYPGFRTFKEIYNDDNSDDYKEFTILMNCIQSVIVSDESYSFDDASEEERNIFIESIDSNTVKKMGEFINQMPEVKYTVKYERKDGTEAEKTIKDIKSFF